MNLENQSQPITEPCSEPKINPLFAFHKLNETGIFVAEGVAAEFHNFIQNIHQHVFNGKDGLASGWEGREWAIVKTKLEEACFYAKKALANQPEFQAK